jgi:PAS domain S-box-containing protein
MPGKPTYRELEERVRILERDATDRRVCQEALMAREQQHRIILETVPDAITVTTMDEGRYLQVNNAFCELSGHSREEALGKTVFDLNLFVDPDARKRMVNLLRSNRAVDRYEIQYRRKDGAILETMLSARTVLYNEQESLLAVVTDLTDLKRASLEIRKSERRFKDMAELLPVVIYEIDTECDVTFLNQSGMQQFELTTADLDKGINALDLVSPQDRGRVYQVINSTMRGVKADLTEFTMIRRDGTTFTALSKSMPIEHGGAPVGMCGVIIDASALKKTDLEKDCQIERLQEALSNLKGSGGLITICCRCKSVQEMSGSWVSADEYFQRHTAAALSHSICPRCSETNYSHYYRT